MAIAVAVLGCSNVAKMTGDSGAGGAGGMPADGPVDFAGDHGGSGGEAPTDGPIDLPAERPCPAGTFLAYVAAGCGASTPQPSCITSADACSLPMCLCRGVTAYGCGTAGEPWASLGACEEGGVAVDAPGN